jgi:hypothetical protein
VRIRHFLLPVLVAALLTGSASSALAGAFELKLEDVTSGDVVTITDNGSGDALASLDTIRFMGTVGSFNVTMTANTFFNTALAPIQFKISNFQVMTSSTTPREFRATLSRTVSSLLVGAEVYSVGGSQLTISPSGNGGGTFENSIDGTTVYTRSVPGTVTSLTGSLPVGSEMDLQTVMDLKFNAGGTMMGSTDLQVRAVPEPLTLLLFGPGLAGLSMLRRRRNTKPL